MNTSSLEALLIELEFHHNDRLPEDRAHFRPGAVGTILSLVPDVIEQTRTLIRQAEEEKRDAFQAGHDAAVIGPELTYEQWAACVPPEVP